MNLPGTTFYIDDQGQTQPLVGIIPDPGTPLSVATVTLNNDQIVSLPSTPVVIIPATEVVNYLRMPSNVPKVIAASLLLDTAAGAYDNLFQSGTDQFLLALGSDTGSGLVAVQYALSDSNPYVRVLRPNPSGAEKQYISLITTGATVESNSFLDNAVALSLQNDAGNLTGGDPSNTLKVVVYYVSVSL